MNISFEEQREQEFTNRVNALYEGFTPMEIRKCVINMCVSQFLDMKMSDILDESHDGPLLNVWSTEREAMDVSDIRWDHDNLEKEGFRLVSNPSVESVIRFVASDTGDALPDSTYSDDDSNA